MQESESEYETGSSDDEDGLAKPVFVPKSDRDTVREREQLELEEMAAAEADKQRAAARKVRAP